MTSIRQGWSWPRTRSQARPRHIWRLGTAVLALILLAIEPAAAGVSIVDDEGRAITLPVPATRVVALYAALGEVVCALDRTDVLAARTRSETEPSAVAALPCIGTHMRPNVELIAGLKPDVVLQMGQRARTSEAVAAIERLGVPVAMFQAHDFESLFSVIRRVGVLLGAEAKADDLIRSMQSRLERVARRIQGTPRPRVFYEVRYPNLLAAGRGSMVSAVIERAGGENCVDSPKKLVRLSEEKLLDIAPEVYLVQRGPMNPDPTPLEDRPHYRTLSAVESGRVLVVDERLYSRPSPRSVQAVEELAAFLHPVNKTKEAGQ